MAKGAKIVSLLAFILCFVFVGISVYFYVAIEREKAEKLTLQNELAQVMKERKKLSMELEELKVIKGDLEIRLSGLETEAKMVAANYEKEKSQNDQLRNRLKKKEQEFDTIEKKLKTVTEQKEKLQGMIETEKEKYGQLKERVEKLVEMKGVLEEKVRDIINKQGIELERIVIKSEGELEGKVVVVNRDYNFIVVDIGANDDIELGDFFTVFRNGKYIGEAQVERIYDTMSAATIVKEVSQNAIMADDDVIVRAN